jgi:hypothetical protein
LVKVKVNSHVFEYEAVKEYREEKARILAYLSSTRYGRSGQFHAPAALKQNQLIHTLLIDP